jgi:Bacterial pre-peptidase C-terminal domain.
MTGQKWFARVLAGAVAVGISLPPGDRSCPGPPPLSEEGVLENGDMVLPSDNSLYDQFTFEGKAGQTVTIKLFSTEFQPYLAVISPQGEVLGENHSAGGNPQNSELELTLATDGTYIVIANGFDASSRGRYTVEVMVVE